MICRQDIGYHLTGAITLLVAGSLVIYSAIDNERTYCHIIYALAPHHFCQFYGIKLAAGVSIYVVTTEKRRKLILVCNIHRLYVLT